MIRLSFWNRIALTVAILFSLGNPLYYAFKEYRSWDQYEYDQGQYCFKLLQATSDGDPNLRRPDYIACKDVGSLNASRLWLRDVPLYVLANLLFSALIYCGIWLVVRLFRWILAGRKNA